MKTYVQMMFLVSLALLCCLLTGFQCGSTEMTSAKLYIQRSDWVNAEKSLEKEVAKNPANAEAWYNLGFARYQMKKYDGMLDAFDQSLKAGSEFAKNISDAKMSAWAQSFNTGVSFQNKMVTASKDSLSILGKEAVDCYQVAVKINPDSASTYQNLAALYHTLGQADDEISTWQKAREKKNDPVFTTYLIKALIARSEDDRAKGDTVSSKKYMDKAITEVQGALNNQPDDPDLLATMINLYIEAGRVNEAMPYIRKQVEKNPANKIAQNNLGLLLLQSDNFDEAIQHFDAALNVDSVYEEALRNGAVAYMKLGEKMKDEATKNAGKNTPVDKAYTEKFKQAVVLLERLVRSKPDNADFWDALATAYGNAGMFKDAERAVRKADSIRKK